MAARIRLGDEVVVISGKDKGKRGRVLRLQVAKNRVVVEGINVITRHLKRNPSNPSAGGRVQKPAAIHLSKVMPWSASDSKGVRVAFEGEGREKKRVAAKSGSVLTPGQKGKTRNH